MIVALDTGVLVAALKAEGEKFHAAARNLGRQLRSGQHGVVLSVLAVEELRGALVARTVAPAERIVESEVALLAVFQPELVPFEPYVAPTQALLLTHRDLKRRLGIPTTDFHHLATAIGESAGLFITVDEKHLLKPATRSSFTGHVQIVNPEEALRLL